jgi:hypothetical protein
MIDVLLTGCGREDALPSHGTQGSMQLNGFDGWSALPMRHLNALAARISRRAASFSDSISPHRGPGSKDKWGLETPNF